MLHHAIYKFAVSKFFDNFLLLCVIANTVVLAMDGMFSDTA